MKKKSNNEKQTSAIKQAVALHYDEEQASPPVIAATGQKNMAQTIQSIALRYGVPIVESPDLAKKLSPLKANSEIPRSLYYEVARLLHALKKKP